MPAASEGRAGEGRRPDPVRAYLEERTREGVWPGAVWIVEEGGRTLSAGAVGWRALVPRRAPAAVETLYDLASLTKPLATAALLALLEQEGALDPSAPASDFLPDLACAREGAPTLLDLALHRAGLPAWRPFYLFAKTPEGVLNSVVQLSAEAPSGARVVYSDPGYILLGEVLRRFCGRGLDALFAERIARPAGVATIAFGPVAHPREEVAPTENGNRYERQKAAAFVPPGDALDESRFRSALIHGEVHDGNAHALGGVAGHAGLFGDAADVARLAREFVGAGSGLFGGGALARFRENRTPGLEEGRTLGWKLAVQGAREAEGVLPAEAFGHTGFTGTSLWLEPETARIHVLLTNRVHPDVRPIDMNGLRRGFHAAASELR